jgi:hypothetical protein
MFNAPRLLWRQLGSIWIATSARLTNPMPDGLFLPHGLSVVGYAADAMEGYELGLHLRFYLHPAGLKADYLISSHDRSVSRCASIDILHACAAEFKLWIMEQAQEEGVAGSHSINRLLIINYRWPLA